MFIEFQVGWLCSWLGHPCDVLMGVDINLFRRMRSFEALWEGWYRESVSVGGCTLHADDGT